MTEAGGNLRWCRTLMCYREPVFRVWIPARIRKGHNRPSNEPWLGYFCHKHMRTVLPLKLLGMQTSDRIVIERIQDDHERMAVDESMD